MKILIPPISQTFFKITKEKYELQSFAVFEKISFSCQSLKLLDNWYNQYGFFDTHIAMFYDVLSFMASVKKCHKMLFLGILWDFWTVAIKHRMS